MTTYSFRSLIRPLMAAAVLLLAATSLVYAQEITVATVELRYVTLDLHGSAVRSGEPVYVTRSDGQMVQFRIEKVLGDKASALPQTSLQGITVGAVVLRASTAGKTSVAGAYKQDAPLMSSGETARARQAQAEQDGQSTAASHAGRNAFLGAVGAMAGGANPGAVNMQAQTYYAQQQANAASGQPVDSSSATDLSARFASGSNGQAAGGSGQRSTMTAQNAAAADISARCSNQCAPQTRAAQAGSMRASYEAAACTCICFYRAVPTTYPGRAGIKQCAIENSRHARELGSNAPVFVGD